MIDTKVEEIINKEILLEGKDEDSKELIVNLDEKNFFNELKKSLNGCKSFHFSVAFINFSGLQLLLEDLREAERNNIKGQIITSTYLNFTDPSALERLTKFSNLELKIFIADKKRGFHTKAYIFEYEDYYKIYIGSSNITQSALRSNEEWNVKIISKKDEKFSVSIMQEYKRILDETIYVDDKFLNQYRKIISEINKYNNNIKKILLKENFEEIKPNIMQKKAIENLKRLRKHGGKRSLVIAATGTGKTYMSAFDVREFNPKRVLFIVHREDILRKAMHDYSKIIVDKKLGLFTGNIKERYSDYIFSTIQTISRYYKNFNKEYFDYIVIDEAHHAAAETYTRIINYFNPKFLLGMTATPERSQGQDIFSIFDNNIALEVRLSEALEEELVVPFHYFGITDISGVDLSDVDLNNISEVTKRLRVNERVDYIIEKINFYGHDGDVLKAVGFCVSVEHAQYMEKEFNKRGIKSVALSSKDSVERRAEFIKRLEDEDDDLKVIFTVDLFNEGVDIPSINMVLMLRPTNSSIIFIQQLGRGLRKSYGKEFLTVLDFIGNHNKVFLIAIALNGARYYDKDSLKVSIATDFANIPGCTYIQMDRVAKERILEQIDSENFNSIKYIKEEYNEFKKMNSGVVPKLLVDYLKFEGAANPIKFMKINNNKSKTYLGFLEKVGEDIEEIKLLENEEFTKILKDLSGQLPLKRPFEFIILRYLILNKCANLEELNNEILKYIESVDLDTIRHSIECLLGKYYDTIQLKNKIILIREEENRYYLTKEFLEVLEKIEFKIYIEDCINYGLLRYEKEFGEKNYGVPFFKLYNQYQMIDAAILSNYRKTHSSFRGSGLLTNNNEWFLFIDLHKEKDIKESINYKDKFINREVFQWQTPNSTSLSSERGRKLINNVESNIKLHLFVRKYKEIDKKVEPYIYIGKGDVIKYEGEKPITLELKLRNKIPIKLYTEFNKKI